MKLLLINLYTLNPFTESSYEVGGLIVYPDEKQAEIKGTELLSIDERIKLHIAVWLRHNKSQMQNNLIEYMQERVCFYANSNDTPAEQVKGMNRLLKDIIRLDEEMFNG